MQKKTTALSTPSYQKTTTSSLDKKIEKACKYKETCTKCFTANSSYLQTTFYGLHINSGLVNDLVKELMNKVRYVNE